MKSISDSLVPLVFLLAVFPQTAGADQAWDWACEHEEECVRALLGSPESWRIGGWPTQTPATATTLAVIEFRGDGFRNVRVTGAFSSQSLLNLDILVTEKLAIFDQLVMLRRQFPEMEARHLFEMVRTTRVNLSDRDLQELRTQLEGLLQNRVPLHCGKETQVIWTHGLSATLFFDPGIDDYVFRFSLPPTDAQSPSGDDLKVCLWLMARWLDHKLGLTTTIRAGSS